MDEDNKLKRAGMRLNLPEEMINAVLKSASKKSTSSNHSPAGSVNSDPLSISMHSSLFEDDDDVNYGRGRKSFNNEENNNSRYLTGEETINRLLEQIDSVRHEKKLLEIDFERAQKISKTQLIESARKYKREIKKLKDEISSSNKELPILRERLDIKRNEFYNLECSPELYEELKRKRSDDLSIKEQVLVRLFEMNSEQRSKIAKLGEDLRKVKEKAEVSENISENYQETVSRIESKYKNRIIELENELSQSKESARENHKNYLASLKQNDEICEKAASYSNISLRCDELERDRLAALSASEQALTKANIAEQNLNAKESQLKVALEQLELVKVDKAYLRRERDDKKNSCLLLEQSLEREKDKVSILEDKLEKQRDLLIDSRENTRSEFEMRLAREVEAIKSSNARQMTALKETQLSTSEREINALLLAKEESNNELDHLRNKIGTLQNEMENLKIELASKQATHQSELSEIRSKLNIRIFENESIANTLELKTIAFRKLEMENEMLQSKIQVLKEEFSSLEVSTSKTITELTAKAVTQDEQIKVYEALELEIDSALLDQAKANIQLAENHQENSTAIYNENAENDNAALAVQSLINIATAEPTNNYKQTLLPVSAQRRVKHSVLLAQRLVETERLLNATKSDLREKSSQVLLYQRKLEQADQNAAISTQPQAYLVECLNTKEDELCKIKKQLRKLKEDNKNLTIKLEKTIYSRQQLHKDLEEVLLQRTALEKTIKLQIQNKNNHETQTSHVYSNLNIPSFHQSKLSEKVNNNSNSKEEIIQEEEENEDIFKEVVSDKGSIDDTLNTSITSETSYASSSSFVLYKDDQSGIPHPKWYRKLRTNE